MSEAQVGGLQDAAKSRKARLLALKTQTQQAGDKRQYEEKGEEEDEKTLKLRNYKPKSDGLAGIADEPAPKELPSLDLVEKDKEVEPEAFESVEVDLTKLAPRKPTWDLKRDIEKQVQKLERRTQRAIAELVAERLRAQADGDLDAQVNAGAVASQMFTVDGDED